MPAKTEVHVAERVPAAYGHRWAKVPDRGPHNLKHPKPRLGNLEPTALVQNPQGHLGETEKGTTVTKREPRESDSEMMVRRPR